MNKIIYKPFLALIILLLAAGCATQADMSSIPAVHPEELEAGRVDCLECHDSEASPALKPYDTFVHSAAFLGDHEMYASQSQELCSACHQPGFCQTCHATSEELKPSMRLGGRPDRMAPHRGDYLVQHRIDGRLDAASCISCHGNRSAATCRRCHN
jgi:hypothetical protein